MSARMGVRRRKATAADRVESLCLFGLDAAMIALTASGQYTRFTTPRTLPYVIFAIVLVSVLTAAAWTGLFRATPRECATMLVSLIVPALLLVIPMQAQASTGFDKYAGGRAIAIAQSKGTQGLHGLDAAKRTITISNDEFGAWYEHIDHNPQQYAGYTIHVTGFVSTSTTLGAQQFLVARQLMSCCILDMTPFGFTAQKDPAPTAHLRSYPNETWVRLTGRLEPGTIGKAGYSYQGMILHISSISRTSAPTGYFYQK